MVYVYIIAAASGICLLCLIVGIVRCVMHKNTIEQAKGPDVSTCADIPNGFNDSISEVDNDINITSLSGPVDTVDSSLKQDMQITSMVSNLSPKINRYVGRPVPNTYPHMSTNMYGQVAEFPVEMPLRTLPHGTLGRGVAVKTLPRIQMQTETDPNTRSLYRYSNAQYYFG